MEQIKIFYFTTKSGKSPFHDWLNKLDVTSRAIVRTRLDRVRLGNFGDYKIIKNGEGICEFRIKHGPGFRIYFGKRGNEIVILLCGGDKGSQDRDIKRAKNYWLECEDLVYE